ncbi:MAG: sugar phosphate isomerase/epimerase [Candidatus Hydrogenedentes bacterium]|nr:sugar phosphate isomerase/epimerase [Candidatus Hydrogenedentota bacterium]
MAETSGISRREFLSRAAAGSALAIVGTSRSSAQSQAGGWQIGCYTRPWDKHDYRVALDAIAEAGFAYVGLMTTKSANGLVLSVETTPDEANAIGEECKKRNLKVPSVYGGGIPSHESVEAGIAGMRKLIDHCVAAGVANLMMGGVGDEKESVPYYKAIAESCSYAAEKGIGISVKPHGGTNSTGPQCRALIEGVNKSQFRLWYDPGNIYYYSDGKLDPVDDAATVDGLVVGMSIKDFKDPKEVLLTPGTGRVDFPKVMARLIQGGFTSGPLIVECLTPGELPQLLEEAKKARAFVESLVKK